nr:LLM class flavin-dependent oxidoreductase [Actinomycetota bacterium]NIU18026.1 LLM class flavin-dependent oxidoreductase [Actinomycetota bacterium]NIU64636.1 LLM class flavin-dependent oxidoreductase [Actinomycetota bacterium]NIW26427.1 LLM class flavin-dependent oxidoreductase [Actinomycetota bacterium]
MKLGLINQLSGRPGADRPAPSWDSIRRRAVAAENAGFDTFVFEDVLLYPGDDGGDGAWESMTIASALAVATDRIELGQSVV